MSTNDPGRDAEQDRWWEEHQAPPPTKKSSPLKWWLLLGCLPVLGLLVCGGGCLGLFGMVFGILKTSEPYTHSLDVAKASPQVIAALGEPIEAGWLPSGSVNLTNDSGTAELDYTISGPKGSAAVTVKATKDAGKWTYQQIEATVGATGEKIDLRQ